jgi:glycosyltransferase involved in cell wall biosynthesis
VSRPLVSVVIPVHNGERFLAETLESALAQEYDPFEVIAVDDGSTDGSAAIARRYAVNYIRQANAGVAAARNAGIAAANGSLIAFLDQDDLWLPAKLERQAAYLVDHPETGVVHVLVEILLEPGTPRPGWLDPAWLERPHERFIPSGVMVRRELFERVGPFDPRYTIGSDTDWHLRAKDAGVASAVIHEVLLRYRIHGENETYRIGLLRSELFQALKLSADRKRTVSRDA